MLFYILWIRKWVLEVGSYKRKKYIHPNHAEDQENKQVFSKKSTKQRFQFILRRIFLRQQTALMFAAKDKEK